MIRPAVAWVGLAAALVAAGAAFAQGSYFDQRLRLFRDLRAFNAELLSHDSATAVLQSICDRRAPGQKIVARKSSWEPEEGALDAARADLGVGPEEPIRYRQVELTCADEVLSSAENWYVPARLTPEMNRALDETRTPFGVVVGPLKFRRRNLASTYLFEPLPDDWEKHPREDFDAAPSPPPHVLQHRAVLATPDGRPFSVVVETYTERVLAQ